MRRTYTNGDAKKIEENDPAITPIAIVKAKLFITDAPKMNIATTTINTARDVPIDLLMVCHTLFSIRFPYNTVPLSSLSLYLVVFSLTLSKIMIVSLILYHMIVSIAMINVVSTVIVLFIAIQSPYQPAGNARSKIIVATVTIASVRGEMCFLIETNENII